MEKGRNHFSFPRTGHFQAFLEKTKCVVVDQEKDKWSATKIVTG